MKDNSLRNTLFVVIGIVIGVLVGMTYASINNHSYNIVNSYENLTEYASFAIEKDADSIDDEKEILRNFGLEAFDDFMNIRKNAQGRLILNSRYNDHLHEYLLKCMQNEYYEDDEVHDVYLLLEPVCEELSTVDWMQEKDQTPFRSRDFKKMMKNLDKELCDY